MCKLFNLHTYSNHCSVRLSVCLNHFTWQLYSHKSHSVISYYSSIQQGVDTHPCLVTIYRLFTDTDQEVSAPNVSTHNRHQLSHQLSVVIASTRAAGGRAPAGKAATGRAAGGRAAGGRAAGGRAEQREEEQREEEQREEE